MSVAQPQRETVYTPTETPAHRLPEHTGIMSWLTTVDHKRIGIMYLWYGLFSAIFAGGFAGMIRAQLAFPEGMQIGDETVRLMSGDFYNQVFTMHGTLMIFFVVAPIFAGFGNYLVPLMIGARDMAFPKMNAFAFWLLIPALALMLGGMYWGTNAAGWTAYPPLSTKQYSPQIGVDFWIFGMHLAGLSTILGAINFIVTISTMRAPGMGWFRMPLFSWAVLTTSWMNLIGAPVFAGALTMILTDRLLGTTFFAPGKGGDPLLYQHLFWFYNHPTVYIGVLPFFGVMSHVLPAFSGRRIFGYKGLVYSIALIGVLSFFLWGHHMFSAGMEPWLRAFFMFSTMVIAVPTGVKVFSWMATIWQGSIRFTVSMMYGLAFLIVFTMGGVTGLFLSNIPFDVQVHDSYFVVAHFHYTYFGGVVLSAFAGLYYWFPKMSGKYLSEKLGRIAFWLIVGGFNLMFLPMHLLGIWGMARRVYTFRPEFLEMNVFISAMYLLMIAGTLVIIYDVVATVLFKKRTAPDDAWGVNDLQQGMEWATSSPPPAHNFDRLPVLKTTA